MFKISPGCFSAPEASSIWSESSNRRPDKEERTRSHKKQSQQKIPVGNFFRSLEKAADFRDKLHEFTKYWHTSYVTCLSTQLMFLRRGEFSLWSQIFPFTPQQVAIAWIQPDQSFPLPSKSFSFADQVKIRVSFAWNVASACSSVAIDL